MDEKNLIAEIVAATAIEFRVSEEDIKGRCRVRVLTDARYLAMYIARERGEYISRIAEFFGITSQAACAGINRTAERLKIYAFWRGRHDRIVRILENFL